MKKMEDFINEIKERHGITKQVELANILQLTQATISAHYNQSGRAKHYSEETAYRIAELLGYDPLYVLSCLAAERAKDEAVRKTWERVSKLLRSTAAGLALLVVLPYPQTTAGPILHNKTEYTLYEVSIFRRLINRLFFWLPLIMSRTRKKRGFS